MQYFYNRPREYLDYPLTRIKNKEIAKNKKKCETKKVSYTYCITTIYIAKCIIK
jgi:hypothetical protein